MSTKKTPDQKPFSFEKGKEYKLRYTQTVPYKRWRGTNIASQYLKEDVCGIYEFISYRGSKLYFYDSNKGIDILISKEKALEALEKGKN